MNFFKKLFNKKNSIKLGEIVDDKLIGFSDSVTWDFDKTLLIFIRDGLKRFKLLYNGVPNALIQEFINSNSENPEASAKKKYDLILDTIIKNIDFYLKSSWQHLTREENEIYKAFLRTYRLEEKDGCKVVKFARKDEEIERIQEKLHDIEVRQSKKLNETFDLLKKYVTSFWW